MSIANWNPIRQTLVVDLDDLLTGQFSMAQGRTPDPDTLCYDSEALDILRRWAGRGGRIALVTGAPRTTAEAVARYLGLFDEAHGADDGNDLTGQSRADFLERRFGPGGYSQIDLIPQDIPLWQSALTTASPASPANWRDSAAQTSTAQSPGGVVRSLLREPEQRAQPGKPSPWLRLGEWVKRSVQSHSTLLLRYTGFAVLATSANLGVQRAVLETCTWLGSAWVINSDLGRSWAGSAWMASHGSASYAGASYGLALMAGTAVGLVVKYALDKRWIFADRSATLADNGSKFARYSLTGVATTLIFWGLETGFWLIWQTGAARELGAVLGLGIGYCTKYQLDRRYVFGRSGAGARDTGHRSVAVTG